MRFAACAKVDWSTPVYAVYRSPHTKVDEVSAHRVLTHKKRAQRSSRRRSHDRPSWTRARPPCSPQQPSGWLALPPSCARPLPLPHSSMPSSVPTPMMRTCPSSRYTWICGDLWFWKRGCLLGHQNDDGVGLLGLSQQKIRPKCVPGSVFGPLSIPT